MKKLILLAFVMTLSACSKLTTENYEALEVGMSADEVNTLLGSADSCSETLGTKSCIWGDEDGKHIKVSFVADNAVAFSNNKL